MVKVKVTTTGTSKCLTIPAGFVRELRIRKGMVFDCWFYGLGDALEIHYSKKRRA